MAKCIHCLKRCNARMGCAYCGRGPMCLNCSCPCRTREEKAEIVARTLARLDQRKASEKGER